MNISPSQKKTLTLVAVAAGVVLVAWWAWSALSDNGPGAGFVGGNGRIEATEIDVATRLPGRVEEILVREGDFVKAGQPLARMQLDSLDAQRAEAEAGRQQAEHAATASEAQVILHQHPRNRERLAQGRAAINALWFWGAGRLPDAVQSRYLHVRSQDPLLQGLARMAGAAIATPGSAAPAAAGDSLVDLCRLRSLELFGTQVLPPLLQAMARREYDALELDFEDGARFRLRHGQRRWQFWRRPLAALAAPAG